MPWQRLKPRFFFSLMGYSLGSFDLHSVAQIPFGRRSKWYREGTLWLIPALR
jgi:hypothetical protein